MKLQILFSFFVIFSGCQTPEEKAFQPDKPENTLSHVSDLGNGFYLIQGYEVIEPESLGKSYFRHVFYHDIKICNCDTYNTVISPDGKYIVYSTFEFDHLDLFLTSKDYDDASLVLFNTASKEKTVLQKGYFGHPTGADWYPDAKIAHIYLTNPDCIDNCTKESISIDLN